MFRIAHLHVHDTAKWWKDGSVKYHGEHSRKRRLFGQRFQKGQIPKKYMWPPTIQTK